MFVVHEITICQINIYMPAIVYWRKKPYLLLHHITVSISICFYGNSCSYSCPFLFSPFSPSLAHFFLKKKLLLLISIVKQQQCSFKIRDIFIQQYQNNVIIKKCNSRRVFSSTRNLKVNVTLHSHSSNNFDESICMCNIYYTYGMVMRIER